MAGAKRRGKKKKNTTFLQQRPPRMSSGYAGCSRPSPTRSTAPLTREKNKRQCGIAALRPPSPAATSELRSCIGIARTLGNWAACLAAASFCNAKTRSISACPFKGPRQWPKPSRSRHAAGCRRARSLPHSHPQSPTPTCCTRFPCQWINCRHGGNASRPPRCSRLPCFTMGLV